MNWRILIKGTLEKVSANLYWIKLDQDEVLSWISVNM
jgi:hypothetical protein